MEKKSSSTESYSKFGSEVGKSSSVYTPPETVVRDPNHIIVRFNDNATEEERVSTRIKYDVTDHKICSCGDKNLELWGHTSNIKAEDALSSMNGNPKDKSKGEHNYFFPSLEAKKFKPEECVFTEDDCIPGNDGPEVNIAILDTGIDLNYFNDVPFLYDTSGLEGCAGNFGRNFIGEGSSDVSDDYGHGTYVTKIITETLNAKGIGYRILPLKVLDSEGNGTFWNLLCAMSYLQKIQKEGAKIHLVNASLGGTIKRENFQDSDFLGTLFKELEYHMLVIASAGNENTNTDGSLRHYPSSYGANNILAVGGHDKNAGGKLKVNSQSNYGEQSIDLAAPYKIEVAGLPVPILEGTSFSTAYVTALAAAEFVKYKDGKPTPEQLKHRILYLTEKEPELELEDGKVKIAGKRAIGSGLLRSV